MKYFRPGDSRGPLGYLRSNELRPSGDRSFFFSVWRPTSLDALRMMMVGDAVGKGLNVKGKSAKEGRISGFVPFVQIHDNSHKRLVGTSPKDSTLRIYYRSAEARDAAFEILAAVLDEMISASEAAESALEEEKASGVPLDDEVRERHLSHLLWLMAAPEIEKLDEFGSGLELPERLFLEACVVRRDITRRDDWTTGRPSEPAFMELNLHSARDLLSSPRVVVWQFDTAEPMNPCGLLVAYEENGRVRPVASDIDAFLIGSRGQSFEAPMPSEQLHLISSMLNHIEAILRVKNGDSWTKRWLEILKGEVTQSDGTKRRTQRRGTIGASFNRDDGPNVPRFGFGDPTSYAIMEHAVTRLQMTGAVRHGAECFNFCFPQELDDEYLVVWEGFSGVPWRYTPRAKLVGFLIDRVSEGFAFPLNPKWILCDQGWHAVFAAMCTSPTASGALECWLPRASGLRERIDAISRAHPAGFRRLNRRDPSLPASGGAEDPAGDDDDDDDDADLAEWKLKRYRTLRRAKVKLRAALIWVRIANEGRRKREAAAAAAAAAEAVGCEQVHAGEVDDDDDDDAESVSSYISFHSEDYYYNA
jgi:hypothetical protein